ncbi:hypothetical protein O6H91_19G032100 [Diphasiastrum complanatum]|uniref:Uncharacterized protein n=1 Tax=Diphasiastrum complanatum TaxID=34168 RepID=A0ACC2ATU5_DIPCM|nr:hypothetical protein O6H91_19G032100 [Diphasiastrum complanatum]
MSTCTMQETRICSAYRFCWHRSKQVIVLCSIGGTLLTYVERTGPKAKRYADPERMFGRQSRSLKAAYELQEENFTNVTHLKGGLNDWIHEGYPVNEDED